MTRARAGITRRSAGPPEHRLSSDKISRRSFIRWVLASGAAMACPFPGSGAGTPASGGESSGSAANVDLKSEGNAVCHTVRDGFAMPAPAPARAVDVVVVGGGPSGLAAASTLKDADFLLLEKENHLGGNAYAESWEGVEYSTGAAWASIFNDQVKGLFDSWKFGMHEIKGLDAACFKGKWVQGFWDSDPKSPAFDALPYPKRVGKSMRKFCRDLAKLDIEAEKDRLDQIPLSQFLASYTPELTAYWDCFGPSNWGAVAAETSTYLGLQVAKLWPADKRYSWSGGMGVASRRIFESLSESAKKRVLTGATVYQVERTSSGAVVRYMAGGEPQAVAARAVVMATPKFIAKYIVSDLPADQYEAMDAMCYAPFLMVNLCFDRVVYNQAYDNYVVGAKNFCDFIPADYAELASGGDLSRKQVITLYAPLRQDERNDLLDDALTKAKAQAAVAELLALFPSWEQNLREVRIYRRGHPMPISKPGWHTKVQPVARRDFPPVFFAASDSIGDISDTAYACIAGVEAAEKALKLL